MFNEKSARLNRVLVVVDLGSTAILLFLALNIHEWIWGNADVDVFSHIALLPLLMAFLVFFLRYFDAYESPRLASRLGYAWSIMQSVSASFILLFTLMFLLKIQYVSRSVILLFWGLEFFTLSVIRMGVLIYFRKALRVGAKFLKVLIIGTGPRALLLADKLRKNSEWGLDILGHLDPDPELVGQKLRGGTVLGTVDDISSVLKGHVVDEVIIAIPRAMIPDVDLIAQVCEEEGVKLRFMADVFDVRVARMRLVELDGVPLLTLEPISRDESHLLIKRTFDLAMSILALPFLFPIFLLISVVIKLDSPGPVFFVQERIGLNKRKFRLRKFRTMVVDAEAKIKDIEHLNEAAGPIFKIKNDPRVTRVGRFLRKSSLDEFPQFINVLLGDMSLIGPRPMSIRDVDLFDKGIQRKRFSVKPGLACLREISGRSKLSFAEWLALDIQYIETWSLGLDLKILLKLIPVVLKGTGAV